MAYFPMFVNMTERECLIVGGGNVAYRKVIVMLDFGAKVTVVAEDICDELRKLTIDDIASEDKTGSYTANKAAISLLIDRIYHDVLSFAILCNLII